MTEHEIKQQQRNRLKKASGNNILRLLAVFLIALALFVVPLYLGSKPKTYALKINDVSPYDIEAPRSVIDRQATERRATEAMAQVPNKMFHSETISTQAINRVKSLTEIITEKRNVLYNVKKDSDGKVVSSKKSVKSDELDQATSQLISQLSQSFDLSFPEEDVKELLKMEDDRFQSFKDHLLNVAKVVMQDQVDRKRLNDLISTHMTRIKENEQYNKEDIDIVNTFLNILLEPNVKYNKEATENARQDAYNQVLNNPIMINRGTRIVSQGDIVTEEVYQLLASLDLTTSSEMDWKQLTGQAVYVLTLLVIGILYLYARHPEILRSNRMLGVLFVSIYVPFVISAYIGPIYPLAPPVYFAAVVLGAYFGFELSFVISSVLILMVLPFTTFNAKFFLVALCGVLVSAALTRGITHQDSFAKLILGTAFVNLVSTMSFSLLSRESWQQSSLASATTVISALLSVVAAIGLMPLFEFIFNTVSPLRLVDLSQPGHPLLKRLSLEAPGTSQHSMMVANLADAAAEKIGANAMICRVGSYYHDIGKLENPMYFTENQGAVNPHDQLDPLESTRIITAHPEDGLKMGKKYRLPLPVLNIIYEHHGTTLLQYFYYKAQKQAEERGEPAPDPDLFRYHTPLPSSRESAVVMLADSTEAALRSADVDNLEEAEEMMRKIFKIKIEQNQFIKSGLSFADVETIHQSFIQTYTGYFHDRIKYPDQQETKPKEASA